MTITEGIKFLVLLIWWPFRQKINFRFDKKIALEQLTYIVPLGIGGLIAAINLKFGAIFISSMIGATALAIYSIGIYQIPVLTVVRSAISDVIFPDMVEKNKSSEMDALNLWKRANVVFCLIVFPIFFIFFIYSEKFITLMFTEQYIDSTPVFQLMLLLMVRRCFELGTPLRSKNKNKFFFRGNILALLVNIAITFTLYDDYGLLAPAIAYVISDLVMATYLIKKILTIYNISLSDLIMWNKTWLITLASCLGLPLLIFANNNDSIVILGLMTILYVAIYYLLLKKFKIEELDLLTEKLFRKIGLTKSHT